MFKKYIDYINDNPKGYWFKAKLFGWGWTPVTWQGWLATGLYVILMIAFALTLDGNSPPREVFFTGIFPMMLLTIGFIRVCYRTGEKPRWQWGLPKKK